MIGIYKITNLINGKCYIGQSINIKQRWKDHKSRAFQNSEEYTKRYLYRSIKQYGLNNFSFEVIEECEPEQLNEKEIYWINYYDSYNNGYNETEGGDRAVTFYKITDNQVKEICELLLNSTLTQREIAKQYNIADSLVSGINHGTNRPQIGYEYPIRKKMIIQKKAEEKHKCPICGKAIDRKAKMCVKCCGESKRKVERPTREELKRLIKKRTFTELGREYGVTDNTIRKWCDSYKLPRKKTDIKNYTDEEWELI